MPAHAIVERDWEGNYLPFDRIVSRYLHLRRNRLLKGKEPVDWDVWFDRSVGPNRTHFDDHIVPLVQYFHGQNFVGRYENLPEDWCKIRDRTGLPELSVKNVAKQSSDPLAYREYYSPQQKDVILRLYDQDLKQFNYEF